jgi:hypothetical protein
LLPATIMNIVMDEQRPGSKFNRVRDIPTEEPITDNVPSLAPAQYGGDKGRHGERLE